MAGEVVKKNVVVREKGYIYYVDKDGSVCRALLPKQHKKKAKKVNEEGEEE